MGRKDPCAARNDLPNSLLTALNRTGRFLREHGAVIRDEGFILGDHIGVAAEHRIGRGFSREEIRQRNRRSVEVMQNAAIVEQQRQTGGEIPDKDPANQGQRTHPAPQGRGVFFGLWQGNFAENLETVW